MPTGADLPEETKELLRTYHYFRDSGRQEVEFRKLSGRRFNKDYAGMSDEELQAGVDWYVNKIEEVLAPYERDEQ